MKQLIITVFLLFLLITSCKNISDQAVEPQLEDTTHIRVFMDLSNSRSIQFPGYYKTNKYVSIGEDGWIFDAYRNDGKSEFYFGSSVGSLKYDELPDTFKLNIPSIPPTVQYYSEKELFVFQDSLIGCLYHNNVTKTLEDFRNTNAIVLIKNIKGNGYSWVLRIDYRFSLNSEVMHILKTIEYN